MIKNIAIIKKEGVSCTVAQCPKCKEKHDTCSIKNKNQHKQHELGCNEDENCNCKHDFKCTCSCGHSFYWSAF